MKDLLSAFQQFLQDQDKSPVTIRGYLSDLRLFARWFEQSRGGPFLLRIWTPDDVRAYRRHLLDQGARPKTINRRLAALASFGNWAVSAGHLPFNPALRINGVAQTALAPRWLDSYEKAVLLRAAKKYAYENRLFSPRLWIIHLRDAAIVILLLNTGLRVSELCHLLLSDVQLSQRKGSLTVRAGKGNKQRIVPLNKEARNILNEWLVYRPSADTATVFVTRHGRPVNPRTVQRAVAQLGNKAGLEGVTPHILRHTFAKSLVDAGVSLEKVAALLGHSDLNTTRIYITPSQQDLEKAVDQLPWV